MTDQTLFDAVLAKPPEERQSFLESACRGDGAKRERLKRLVAEHGKASGILDQERDASALTAAYVPASTIAVGTMIAERFKILECLGEGGMGTVYVAEQTQPVR